MAKPVYLVFAGEGYYARGGYADLYASAENEEKALAMAENLLEQSVEIDWYEVVKVEGNNLVLMHEKGSGCYRDFRG